MILKWRHICQFYHQIYLDHCVNVVLVIIGCRFSKAGIVESIDERDVVHCVIVMILGMRFIVCLNVVFVKKLNFFRYYFVRPNTLKMDQLFNLTSHSELIQLCKFLQDILNSLKFLPIYHLPM